MKNRKPKRLYALGVVGVFALSALASCSSDDKSSTDTNSGGGGTNNSAAPTTSKAKIDVGVPLSIAEASKIAIDTLGAIKVPEGATVRGINGKVITIGGVATAKDPNGTELFPGVCDGAKARLERANREGGVNGYTFKYVGCADDGQNPSNTQQQVQQKVEKDNVFALIPYTSVVGKNAEYLSGKHVPYFGWGINAADYCGWNDKQFGFAATMAISCTTAMPGKAFFSSVGLETYLQGVKKDPKGLKVAFVGANQSASAVSINAFRQIGLNLGMDVVYAKTPIPDTTSPPLTDYTPVAQEIISSGAQVAIMPLSSTGSVLGLIGALKKGGYTGDTLIFFADSRLGPLAPQLDKVYAATGNYGVGSFDSPQFQQVKADLAAIDSKASYDASGTLTSYVSADLFLTALATVKGDLTTEAISHAINDGLEYPALGNLVCATSWPAGHVVAANCQAMIQFDGATKTLKPVVDIKGEGYGHDYLFPLG
jgi:branched-chain amino acid transport system substrate-binding protein